jgi:hypothetical protein
MEQEKTIAQVVEEMMQKASWNEKDIQFIISKASEFPESFLVKLGLALVESDEEPVVEPVVEEEKPLVEKPKRGKSAK